jgi:hypothetical protein
MIDKNNIRRIYLADLKDVLKCLGNGKISNVKPKDKEVVKKYFISQ